jgi:integrase
MVRDDMDVGYSASAVRRHVFVLRGILEAAKLDGRVGRNVAESVTLPAESARPMRFLDPDQLVALANAVPGHYRPLVLTAGWVGLRWGELAGLALDRVDLLRHRITVDRQLTDVNGRLAFGPPKTRAGVRTVSIPAGLTEILGEHFATRPVQTSGLAFPTVTGKPMRRTNFRSRWRAACRHAFGGTDLEGLVFHELRHTAAALAIEQGAHPLTVKDRLGHSSITVTMDVYGHLFPGQDQALAEALDERLRASLAEQRRNSSGTVSHLRSSEA